MIAPAASLRRRALRMSVWVVGTKPIDMAVQLIRSLVLTRLLFPEAFGLMALVGVVLQGIQMCADFGISANIMQSRRGEDLAFLQTAWTVQVVRGAMLWVVCCILAWPVAWFYAEPDLLLLLPICGLNVLISGFNTTTWSVHSRKMEPRRVTFVSYVTWGISFLVTVWLAWIMKSVWALVLGSLISTLVTLIGGFLFLPGIPHRFRWDPDSIREMIHFGKWLFLSTLLMFAATQMDKLVLGKLLPMEVLGIYSIAMVVAMVPRDLVQSLAGSVLFPAVAQKVRENPQELQDKLNRARGVLLRVGLLMCLAAVVGAPIFFHYLYDDRYADAGWMAQGLSLAVWMTVLKTTTGYVLLALGDGQGLAFGNLCHVVATTIGVLVGFQVWGVPGFIVGYALGAGAGEWVQGMWIRRHGVRVLSQDGYLTLMGFAAIGAVEAIGWLTNAVGHPPGLVREFLIGGLVWLVWAAGLMPGVLAELRLRTN